MTAAGIQAHVVFQHDEHHGYTMLINTRQPNGVRVRFEALVQPTGLAKPVSAFVLCAMYCL